MKRWMSAGTAVLVLGFAIAGCNENNHNEFGSGSPIATSSDNNPGDTPVVAPANFAVSLEVYDEDNAPVPGATVRIGTLEFLTGSDGKLTLSSLDQPVVAVIEKSGFLTEPVCVGRSDIGAVVSMQLLRRLGPNGERRTSLHFGGDAMMGRRYTLPNDEGLIRVSTQDGGVQARRVVEALAPLFKAADVQALNFESLISDLPESVAYPLKRYIIQSPKEAAIPALELLEVDAINLSNNHLYDWEDPGVIETLAALRAANLPFFGAGINETEAREPLIHTAANGIKIGFLGYTPIDGDNGNDALPSNASVPPANLSAASAWKYEFRQFGFVQGAVAIAEAPRRAGEAWRLFKAEEEGGLTGDDLNAYWAEMRRVYPELQDIVARRGHGGPNFFKFDRVSPDIAALRAAGCDIVIVQEHNGYEYAEHKNPGLNYAARLSIDNGADMFVGHHSHSLNGVEYYKGKLMVNSLGNLFFDQNLMVTYTSMVVRVVFEEGNLIQTRIYPTTIDDYRTAPVVGTQAERVIRTVKERTVLPVITERDSQRRVYPTFRADDADITIPDFVFENNSARVIAPVTSNNVTRVAIQLAPGEVLPITGHVLTRSRSATGGTLGLEFARDVYHNWGTFEDLTADMIADAETHWQLNATTHRAEAVPDAPDGFGVLRLRRVQSNLGRTTVLPVSRAPMLKVRYYEASGTNYVPASDEARYSLRFQYRLIGDAPFEIRMKFYAFVDSDPFIRPSTTFLRELTIPVDLIADGEWHDTVIDIPPSAYAPGTDGQEAVFGIPILDLYPATTEQAILLIDTFQFYEWHDASSFPDSFYGVDAIRSLSGGTSTLTLEQR